MSEREFDGREYEVMFEVRVRDEGDEDFTVVGFGASGIWDSMDECAHTVLGALQNDEWDIENEEKWGGER